VQRRRKHWGWGYEDEQPSLEELRGAAGFLSERLGFGSTEPELQRILDWAVPAGAAVIPFGGGTSVVGGVEASKLPPDRRARGAPHQRRRRIACAARAGVRVGRSRRRGVDDDGARALC
jgi:hypothetical protein